MEAARINLPGRRHGESFAFNYEGHGFRVTVGCDPRELTETGQASPLEVFVNADKVDSGLEALASDIAILISLLLQHGAEAKAIGHALRRNPNNSRASLVGALVDVVFEFSFSKSPSMVQEQDCRGHVASANDPRVCGRCGVHIDSLRPDDAPRAGATRCPVDGNHCDCIVPCGAPAGAA